MKDYKPIFLRQQSFYYIAPLIVAAKAPRKGDRQHPSPARLAKRQHKRR